MSESWGALVAAVRRHTETQPGESPFRTAFTGLVLLRSDHEKPPGHLLYVPALCVVAQGAKWAMAGEQRYDYRAGQALVVSVEMPLSGRVAEASPQEPYLGLIVELDLAVMRTVFAALAAPPRLDGETPAGLFVADVDATLADCLLRMVRLLDAPDAIPLLAPAIMRELCYWLLTGPHGAAIAKLTLGGGRTERVLRALHTLRERFAEPVRVEELARIAQLSPSAFHRAFKALTGISPLQYQKQLRLIEARELLVAGGTNVETAAYRVGYESPSQFSRDYARMFGAPPRRDAAALRALSA
ncbi:MAG TPA: AraC family transcriptional regulator [Candidatus Limnocylindria bacterium]|nr:AraC family transcriptional regulator [Candidatus Limnocylindria bacterium]